ncbi:MAG: hypothetical protein EP299_01845 [Acidobacteria bacterium]|nr:MAG: hypothetical protein EP299_01845 [Acidobacteriota bacterium]
MTDGFIITFGDDSTPASEMLDYVVTFGDGEEPTVYQLPLGATFCGTKCRKNCKKHNPEGYATEAEYLSAFRPRVVFRVSDSEERASHRRWGNSAPSVVQLKLDELRGAKAAAKLRTKAALPAAFGCPNLILGT